MTVQYILVDMPAMVALIASDHIGFGVEPNQTVGTPSVRAQVPSIAMWTIGLQFYPVGHVYLRGKKLTSIPLTLLGINNSSWANSLTVCMSSLLVIGDQLQPASWFSPWPIVWRTSERSPGDGLPLPHHPLIAIPLPLTARTVTLRDIRRQYVPQWQQLQPVAPRLLCCWRHSPAANLPMPNIDLMPLRRLQLACSSEMQIHGSTRRRHPLER
jgi:hypothetical protein